MARGQTEGAMNRYTVQLERDEGGMWVAEVPEVPGCVSQGAMEHDRFSLDDKRQSTPGDNDIPDVLACWNHRHAPKFQKKRDARLAELRE